MDAGAVEPSERVLAGVRGVMLDLDGVVYREDTLLPGAPEFVSFVRRTCRRLVAVTNNSARSAAEYAEKLGRLDVPIPEEDIITSAWATAQYLRRHHRGARVLVVGSPALKRELRAAGLVESRDPEYVVVHVPAPRRAHLLHQPCRSGPWSMV